MWPVAYDALLSAIRYDPVFSNSSNNEQIDPGEQLAVTLYRMGHFGNAISMGDVSLWAGMGYGTMDWCTWHIFIALLWDTF